MLDPLSAVLGSVRLTGGVFLDAQFTAPWCVLAKVTAEDCGRFATLPSQIIAYHFIIDGSLLIAVEHGPETEAHAGEIVLLPRNDQHTLASGRGLEPVRGQDLLSTALDGKLARLSLGGGGEPTHLVCGFLASEKVYNPLITALPSLLKINLREGTSRSWIEASMRYAADELMAGRLASSGTMSRLSELLFVEAVRSYASAFGEDKIGWLRGAVDPQIGRALALMHEQMEVPWTAELLAEKAAMSRSAFVDRFTKLVGLPPIRYLTLHRLEAAKPQLCKPRMTIAQIAHAVGYESDEAFSRAFKREFGMAPRYWRIRNCG